MKEKYKFKYKIQDKLIAFISSKCNYSATEHFFPLLEAMLLFNILY